MRKTVRKFPIRHLILLIPIAGSAVLISLSLLLDLSNSLHRQATTFERPPEPQKCRDWHDYKQMLSDRERRGAGENGTTAALTDASEIEENERRLKTSGFAVVISDKISVNRSVPDLRPKACAGLRYPAQLPTVSVIIIFHNEIKSVLLRTVHSVINRTPPELLHEVVLVNDCSTDDELYEPLARYVSENFGAKVRIKNLAERKGLIVTRLEGAAVATGEVLVFFDSHIEVSYNWLPPLITPIKWNRRLATVPVIDNFESNTFEIGPTHIYGSRGGFDWNLIYRRFLRYLPEGVNPIKPFPNPIMLGCAFAIDRKFFLDELGGYDREFKIWNGENYELSLKLWLCADGLFEVPCSRVAHSFRMINPSRNSIKEDFVGRNFKRLLEVWFDDYKHAVYGRDVERYAKVDAGDLSAPLAIKSRLRCKPFSYFIDTVAPDMLERYPLAEKLPVFASGQLKSMSRPDICMDTLQRSEFEAIGLFYCENAPSADEIPRSQFFRLTFHKNIALGHFEYCLDSYNLAMPQCHYSEGGNQYWRYDHVNHLLINAYDEGPQCLAAVFEAQAIEMRDCDANDSRQKWTFTYENVTALEEWKDIYGYRRFSYGDRGVNREQMMPLEHEDDCNPEL